MSESRGSEKEREALEDEDEKEDDDEEDDEEDDDAIEMEEKF